MYDVTTGQSGATARPGDTLKYTLTIRNMSTLSAVDFSLTDELDKLNSSAMFVPGSLKLLTVPAGADTSLTSATGGSNGTGLVRIGNLNIDVQGGANDTVVIEFQAKLAPAITSGTHVLNQAQIGSSTLPAQLSDDPTLDGTTDPTLTTITSMPAFRILKTVQDITSGTATVMAGDTLRYTITVKNIGTENATGVTLRDQIPANTSYVANSTRLNGAAVADPSAGVSVLQNGMKINSPANLAAGVMPADASTATANIATITFDVKISTTVVDGTIISNQGFVNGSGAGSGTFPEQPSDNPATPDVPNDPTTVVVGNLPLVYALKTVKVVDNNSDGVVNSGDVLHYIITLSNSAATPATGVVLTDAVPQYTTYVPGTVTLNGIPVADLSSGSPLASGMAVSSSDLTPPVPAAGAGTLSPGESAAVTFDVQVNDNIPSESVPAGTLISNQGSVATAQLPALLTDADGTSSNGYQPTVVVIGNAQQLSIIKSISVVGGGAALPDSQLEYTIRVTNIGMVPATSVVLTDAVPQYTTYVPGTVTLNGIPVADLSSGSPLASGMAVSSSDLTPPLPAAGAGTLSPGESAVVRFDAKINQSVAAGTTVNNTASVSWNSPDSPKDDSASVNVGAIPGSASLNGLVWHDVNFNKLFDSGSETGLEHWSVELYRNHQLIGTQETNADGAYRFTGLAPNMGTPDLYELRFRAEGAGPNTASMGQGYSPPELNFTDGPQRISSITVASGSNLQNLNLPLQPNGAVYDSVTREAVAGARLVLLNAATKAPLPTQCFDDPVQQNQVTTQNGFYKFDLNFSGAACPAPGNYLIEVTPPATGYTMPSKVIPPASGENTAAYDVTRCPDDAVPATGEYCEATGFPAIPPRSVRPSDVGPYYLNLLLGNGDVPGQSQIFNNPIPLDPELNGAVAITKTSPKINVTRGDLVPYTITVTNVYGVPLYDISIVDRFPAGFKYVAGSARLDGKPVETDPPKGRELTLKIPDLQVNQKYTIKLLLVVGSGVSEDEYVNRAMVVNAGGTISGEASATVRVIPDPTFDCTDVIGKVFDDRNLNGQQDTGEKGLPGVRVATVRGLIATSDKNGRFHITCAAIPDEDRGSNFILKLDERTLPSGYRLTTENPRVQRATRGKMLRFKFGATIHHVVSIDIADGVFEPNTTELRLQWRPKIAELLEQLKKAPSVLRLSYLADVEPKGLVKDRLDALKKQIAGLWEQSGGGYRLAIETEIFWRRGTSMAGQ
ncbi:MAG: SdrD B-like domain-containing protein [Gammaproteobacteria bacterium]